MEIKVLRILFIFVPDKSRENLSENTSDVRDSDLARSDFSLYLVDLYHASVRERDYDFSKNSKVH